MISNFAFSFQCIIVVKPSAPPVPVMNEENLEKLKIVMSSRYDPSIKSLDLSNLAEDKNLVSEGLICGLHRHIIILNVAKIIEKNIPEVRHKSFSYIPTFSSRIMKACKLYLKTVIINYEFIPAIRNTSHNYIL